MEQSKITDTTETYQGPNKKLKEGVKYNIEAIKPNGEPLAPKKIVDKFIR